ncbi:MAG: hypothetical protein ACD_56C00043G0003 [uncultured bacterium]|nr:MAG: hypothetical protein ACD_56C00043G0003 [uncultured bacterium]
MTKFSDSVIGKIKCEKIMPVPKWHFLIRSYAFWLLFFVSMILGSLSFSVVVHIVNSGDLDIMDHLQGSWMTSAFMLLPVFWIVSLFIFAISAYLNWKCTRLGYCARRRWIVLGSIVLSIIFGSVFYVLGLGKQADNAMTRAVPIYDQYKHKARKELWLQPEKGFLTGKILDVDEIEERLIVRDENGKKWIVTDKDIRWENESLEEKGNIIKVIGIKKGDFEFQAREIRRCTNCQDDEFVEKEFDGVCFNSDGGC